MKKIAILTYQNALNFGAAYQCKALYQFVRSENKYQVVVVDYVNNKFTDKTKLSTVFFDKQYRLRDRTKKLIISIVSKRIQKRFASFYKDVMFSDRYNENNFSQIDKEFDYFIIGSDQLWNFDLNDGDMNYLLPFVDKDRIVTYATSIGKEEVADSYVSTFTNNIKDINYLSVRENEAKVYINSLLPDKSIDVVLDPVFLLDSNKWKKYIIKNKTKCGASFYLFHKNFYSTALSLSKSLDINHRHITKICGGLSIKDMLNPHISTGTFFGPIEVLNAIYFSEIVFTDSFHCVAISIIYHIDFFVFLTGDRGRDSRIIQLLNIVGLNDRIINDGKIIKSPIDWSIVDNNLHAMKQFSQTYLRNAINSFG